MADLFMKQTTALPDGIAANRIDLFNLTVDGAGRIVAAIVAEMMPTAESVTTNAYDDGAQWTEIVEPSGDRLLLVVRE